MCKGKISIANITALEFDDVRIEDGIVFFIESMITNGFKKGMKYALNNGMDVCIACDEEDSDDCNLRTGLIAELVHQGYEFKGESICVR